MAAKKTAKKIEKPAKAKAAPAATEVLTRSEVSEDSLGSDIDKRKKLREFAAAMNKDRRVVAMADEAPNVYELRRPTGIIQLDKDIGGGFPAGGLSVVSGPDNCLAEDTFIQYETRTTEGKRSNHKGGTIRKLFERFHGLTKKADTDLIYSAPSVNDESCVLQNRVVNVIKTGRKQCFELTTKGGLRIIATSHHKFFNGVSYVRLGDLKIGDAVLVHLRTTNKNLEKDKTRKSPRAEIYVRNHPNAPVKIIRNSSGEYQYKRLFRSRAVVEAAMNNMGLEEYVNLLNFGKPRDINRLKFLTSEQIVHHEDENTLNDSLDNLLVVTRAEHMLEHLKDKTRENYMRFVATEDYVESITPVGLKETYDIKMAAPFHNYVANKFVVHNSGKTWVILRTMAMHQRLYGQKSCLAFAAGEGAFDYKRALSAGLVIPIPDEMIQEWNQERLNLGMPAYTQQDVLWFKRKIGEFTILRGHTGEELMNVVLEAVKANIFGIIGVDSFSMLLPEADEDKDVGGTPKRAGNANLMTDFLKKYTPYTSGLHDRNETSLIGIMQVRANAAKADAGHLAKYLKDWAVTGAYATRHGKLVDVTVWDGSPLKKTVQGQQVIYGKPFYWKIEKGKAGCHDNVQGETEFRYDIPHGHDDIWALIVAGTRLGVFVEENKKIQVYHPITKEKTDLGGYPSFPAFGRVLAEDFEFELQMRLYVLAAAGVQCLYRPLA